MDKKIENGILAINRINLLMGYSLDKTYTENLQEQPDSKMPFQIEKFGYKQGDPSTLGPALEKQSEVFRSLADLDSHDWLSLVEVSTGVFGMLPTPLAPILLGISTAAGIADAALYFKEGDNYMGTMMLALTIIPGGELLKVIKKSKVLTKRGTKETANLIKKYKNGGKLTAEETDDIVKLAEDFSKNADEVAKLMEKTVEKSLLVGLGKKSLKYLVNLLYLLGKLGVGIGKTGLQIGGTYYLFDEIYLAVFANDQKNLDIRKYSSIQQLVALIKKDEEYFKDLMIHESEKAIEEANKKGIDLISVSPKESIQANLDKFKDNVKQNEQKKFIEASTPPSFEAVLSGKINPKTKKPYTINKSHQGETVKKLQRLLIKLGYEDMLSGYYSNKTNAVDGVYGDDTESAVKSFQEDNNITPVDGIVGQRTLKSLIEKTK